MSEHEAFLPRTMSQRRFSSHATGSVALQSDAPRATMLPSHRYVCEIILIIFFILQIINCNNMLSQQQNL